MLPKDAMRRYATLISVVAAVLACGTAVPNVAAAGDRTVRDAMWIGHMIQVSTTASTDCPATPRRRPSRGAESLGLSNLIMIEYNGMPAPPYNDYAASFSGLNRFMWSVVGGGGQTSEESRDAALSLAATMPNMSGVFMDDFFQNGVPTLSVAQLQQLRSQLTVGGRALDLGVTLYTTDLGLPDLASYLAETDIISLWTWNPADLTNLDANLTTLESLAPNKQIYLGLYMWDFNDWKPISQSLMEYQCAWVCSGFRKDGSTA